MDDVPDTKIYPLLITTTKDHFFTSIRIFGTFLKITGVNLDRKSSSKWGILIVKLCSLFWILVSIQNCTYLIVLRGAFRTMINLLVANKDSSGNQLMEDFIFILRQLGIPFFTLITHILLYNTVGSTMKSFWAALKPINRLLHLHDLSGIRKTSIFALICIITSVSITQYFLFIIAGPNILF